MEIWLAVFRICITFLVFEVEKFPWRGKTSQVHNFFHINIELLRLLPNVAPSLVDIFPLKIEDCSVNGHRFMSKSVYFGYSYTIYRDILNMTRITSKSVSVAKWDVGTSYNALKRTYMIYMKKDMMVWKWVKIGKIVCKFRVQECITFATEKIDSLRLAKEVPHN